MRLLRLLLFAIPAVTLLLLPLGGCGDKVTEKTGSMEQVKDKFPKKPGQGK